MAEAIGVRGMPSRRQACPVWDGRALDLEQSLVRIELARGVGASTASNTEMMSLLAAFPGPDRAPVDEQPRGG